MPRQPTIVDESMRAEAARAQWWRRNVVKLSVQELADLTGYTANTIYFMERGIASDGTAVKRWAWQRYKTCCAGVEAELINGFKFEWRRQPESAAQQRTIDEAYSQGQQDADEAR